MQAVSAPTTQLYKTPEELLVVSPVNYKVSSSQAQSCCVYNSQPAPGPVSSSTVKERPHFQEGQVSHDPYSGPPSLIVSDFRIRFRYTQPSPGRVQENGESSRRARTGWRLTEAWNMGAEADLRLS